MTAVVDAALVVAALIDSGAHGTWAVEVIRSQPLAAPHLMPVEVANILRRAALTGRVSRDNAAMAHGDLLDLPVALFPYEIVAARVWELCDNFTTYDGSYVALAELLDVQLATLDIKMSRSPSARCSFLTPPG